MARTVIGKAVRCFPDLSPSSHTCVTYMKKIPPATPHFLQCRQNYKTNPTCYSTFLTMQLQPPPPPTLLASPPPPLFLHHLPLPCKLLNLIQKLTIENFVLFSVCPGVGKRLHTPPSHPKQDELQGFSGGTLTTNSILFHDWSPTGKAMSQISLYSKTLLPAVAVCQFSEEIMD